MNSRFLLFTLVLALGCTYVKPKKDMSGFIGTVKNITIDHVLEKRDWCRFTRIVFSIELKNLTNNKVKLIQSHDINYCKVEGVSPGLFLESYGKIALNLYCPDSLKTGLTFIELPKNGIVYPNSSTIIKCMLLSKICGTSLEQILNTYSPLFNSSFQIRTNSILKGQSKTFLFKKSKDFEICLKLDDKSIFLTDTLNLRKYEELP